MGNKSSKEQDEFHENWVQHSSIKDPRYDSVKFYHNRHDPQQLVMLKDRYTNEPGDSQEINALIETRKEILHPNLCTSQSYIQQENSQNFSSFYKHHQAFEYYDNNQDIQTKSRAQMGYNAPEEQLWYTAHALVESDCLLAREGGSYHGDLQPSTVLHRDQSEIPDVKTIDSQLVHLNKSTYSRMLYNKNIKAAASPTLCSQLEEKKVNPVYQPTKEESWGLGMTMLCQGTNTTLDDYYDWSIPRVNMDSVENGLSQLDNQHSNQLHGFVRNCLQESEEDRPSMEEHEQWFAPYANDARNKRLTFKNVRQQVEALDADNFFDVAELEEIVRVKEERIVESRPSHFKDPYAEDVIGKDDFFNTSHNMNVSQNYQQPPMTYTVNSSYQNPQQTNVNSGFIQQNYTSNSSYQPQQNYNVNSSYQPQQNYTVNSSYQPQQQNYNSGDYQFYQFIPI